MKINSWQDCYQFLMEFCQHGVLKIDFCSFLQGFKSFCIVVLSKMFQAKTYGFSFTILQDDSQKQNELTKIKRPELRQSKRSPEMGCCGWLQVRFNNLNGSHFQITPMMSSVKMNEISLCHCLWLQSFVGVRVPQIPKSLNL